MVAQPEAARCCCRLQTSALDSAVERVSPASWKRSLPLLRVCRRSAGNDASASRRHAETRGYAETRGNSPQAYAQYACGCKTCQKRTRTARQAAFDAPSRETGGASGSGKRIWGREASAQRRHWQRRDADAPSRCTWAVRRPCTRSASSSRRGCSKARLREGGRRSTASAARTQTRSTRKHAPRQWPNDSQACRNHPW